MPEQQQKEEDYLAYCQLADKLLARREDNESIVIALRKYARENFDQERFRISCLWVFARERNDSKGDGNVGGELLVTFINEFTESFDCGEAGQKLYSQTKDRTKTIVMLYAAIQCIRLIPEYEKKIKRKTLSSRIFLFVFSAVLFFGGIIGSVALAYAGIIFFLLVAAPIVGLYGMYKSLSEIFKVYSKIGKLTK